MNHRIWISGLVAGVASALGGCASWLPADDPEPIVRGPFATRNQQPIALTLMAFRPRRATVQPEGTLGVGTQLAWSDMEEIRRFDAKSPAEAVAFDGETVRSTLRGRYGIAKGMDIEVELPFLWAGAGGMDHFIEEYHEFFNLPDGARNDYPDDQFDMSVQSGGDTLYDLQGNEIRMQDIPVFVTWQVAKEERNQPAIATRIGVEFPTGSEKRGFGNGAFDFGAGLIAEKSIGRWTVTGGFDWVFPGQSDRLRDAAADHHYDPMLALELAGEYRWNDSLSVVLGTIWTSRMIHTVALEEVNREVFDLGWGIIWDWEQAGRWSFSMHEDLVAATGSDLSAHLGWVWGY